MIIGTLPARRKVIKETIVKTHDVFSNMAERICLAICVYQKGVKSATGHLADFEFDCFDLCVSDGDLL